MNITFPMLPEKLVAASRDEALSRVRSSYKVHLELLINGTHAGLAEKAHTDIAEAPDLALIDAACREPAEAACTAGESPIHNRATTSNPPANYQNATKCYHRLVASQKCVWPQFQ